MIRPRTAEKGSGPVRAKGTSRPTIRRPVIRDEQPRTSRSRNPAALCGGFRTDFGLQRLCRRAGRWKPVLALRPGPSEGLDSIGSGGPQIVAGCTACGLGAAARPAAAPRAIGQEISYMLPTRNRLSDTRSPEFETSGLDAGVHDQRPEAAGPPDAGRRGFFRRLAYRMTNTAATSAPRRAPQVAALRMSGRCMNHGFCAAICATHALRRYETEAATGLAFDAASCDACGLCVRSCPEHALRLDQSESVQDPAQSPLVLTRFEMRPCRICGKPFAQTGEAAWCPACRTRGRLGRDLFGSVFALR